MHLLLNLYFLFQIFIFKNVRNTVDNISKCKNGAFKAKTTLAAATLGFKSLWHWRLRRNSL